MIVTDQKPLQKTAVDPWSDWKPSWTGKKQTPHDLQEKHSPTQSVDVALTAERSVHRSQRRITDARLWEQMTVAQQNAALEIAAAFEMMGQGLGYVTSNWQRIPGCRNANDAIEARARMVTHYVSWAQKCAAQKISHAMIIDVLAFGFSCRMIDHDRRLKNGATRENLMKGLSLYCELRGWA